MSYKTITIVMNRSNGLGFKVQEMERSVLVKQVSTEGAAYLSGLRSGDLIFSVNDTDIFSAEDFLKKLETSENVRLTVKRAKSESAVVQSDVKDRSHQKIVTKSLPRTDLISHPDYKQILQDNYVPEEFIDSYLQPMSKDDNVEKLSLTWTSGDKLPSEPSLSGEISDSPQITRKQAYQKQLNDVNDGPKFSFKKATKATSLMTKDPSYVIKKKTNTKMGDFVTAVTTTGLKSRNLSLSNQPGMPADYVNQLSPSSRPDRDHFSAVSGGSQLPSPSCQQQATEHDNVPPDNVYTPPVSLQELSVKVLSFNGKIRKTSWKRFTIESDSMGVLFHSTEFSEMTNPCNSTAIDPHISGLNMFMDLWPINNTISRFLLPIGHPPYDSDIVKEVNAEHIRVLYSKCDVDLLISVPKMPDDKMTSLFSLLKIELPRPEVLRPPPTKPRRSMTSQEHKSRKQIPLESTRNFSLSNLPQSNLVENVPLVVLVCVSIVEKVGLKNEGIYRKPGNDVARKKLENVVSTESPAKWSECEEWRNVNTAGSLLKSVLRTYCLIDRDTAIKLSMVNLTSVDESNEEQVYKDMVYHLKQHLCKTDAKDRSVQEIRCRVDTFKYLIRHLERVTRCEQYNMMSASNLATCFSPTIIEDIPCDEDGEYRTSKKSEADKNLKQMVTFWIANADLVCELLEEDDQRQRHDRLVSFLRNKSTHNVIERPKSDEMPDEESVHDVKELIEYYTSTAFTPECTNAATASTEVVTDVDNFTAMKNLGAYRSYKQPKSKESIRRSSLSLSPRVQQKVVPVDVHADTMDKDPVVAKKAAADNWRSKSFHAKGKERARPPESKLTSMRISGSTKDVPLVIDVCIRIMESFGLGVDGVYRISASKPNIEMLQQLVSSKNFVSWSSDPYVELWSNIYVVSCLLKSVLKQMCLIKKETWVHMSSKFTDKMTPDDVRKVLMAAAYHLRQEKGPRIDYTAHDLTDRIERQCEGAIRSATLRYVLKHLKLVSLHARYNRMNSCSLAVCFMPALIEENNLGDMVSTNKTIQILEKLVDHCDWIFQWDDTPLYDLHGTLMSDSLDRYLAGCDLAEGGGKTLVPGNEVVTHHLVDQDKVRTLLKNLVDQSHVVAQSRISFRRCSDDLNISDKKTDRRESKLLLDDCQLPDRTSSDGMCYMEPRITGSLT